MLKLFNIQYVWALKQCWIWKFKAACIWQNKFNVYSKEIQLFFVDFFGYRTMDAESALYESWIHLYQKEDGSFIQIFTLSRSPASKTRDKLILNCLSQLVLHFWLFVNISLRSRYMFFCVRPFLARFLTDRDFPYTSLLKNHKIDHFYPFYALKRVYIFSFRTL